MRQGLLSLLLCFSAAAQNISSGLSGTIVDSSGAAVPDAQISARNEQTGFQRDTKSNGSGYFAFPDLTPGAYALAVQAEGFKKHAQAGIPLNSGEQRSMGRIKLDVGALSDTVTVTTEVTQVQLGSSEKSGSITQEMLQNMAFARPRHHGRRGADAGRDRHCGLP